MMFQRQTEPRLANSANFRSLFRMSVGCLLLYALLLLVSPNYRWNWDKGDSPYGSDFLQDWTAANMLVHQQGDHLYDSATFDAWQHAPERIGFTWNTNAYYPTVYPPPYYWLLGPWGWIDYRWAVPLWLGVLLACLVASVAVVEGTLRSTASRSTFAEIRVGPTWFWPAMLLCPPVLLSLTMGQKGAVWLLIYVVTWSLLRRNQPWGAGLIFGLLSVKPTLFFLFPLWMLYHRQWKFVAATSMSWGCLWLAAATRLPLNVWADFWEVARGVASYHQHGGYQLPWSCNLLALSSGLQNPWLPEWIGYALISILAGFALLRTGRSQAAPDGFLEVLADGRQLACVLLATCLLSPHFYAYDLVVLLLPARLLWNQQPKQAAILLGAVCVGMWGSQLCYATVGLPWMPLLLLGALYSLSAVTPGQSSVRNGVSGSPAPSNILQTGLSPQA
jgi:hypothetical protein